MGWDVRDILFISLCAGLAPPNDNIGRLYSTGCRLSKSDYGRGLQTLYNVEEAMPLGSIFSETTRVFVNHTILSRERKPSLPIQHAYSRPSCSVPFGVGQSSPHQRSETISKEGSCCPDTQHVHLQSLQQFKLRQLRFPLPQSVPHFEELHIPHEKNEIATTRRRPRAWLAQGRMLRQGCTVHLPGFCEIFVVLFPHVSLKLYPLSCIPHPVSCIVYLVSCIILYPLSCILHPVSSCILYPACCILCPMSCTRE